MRAATAPVRVLAAAPGYQELRPLGAGRLTEVLLAADAAGRRLAVKRLKPALAGHPGARRALRDEFRVLHQVQGPGIVQVAGWLDGIAGGAFATEYMAYGDLLSLIGQRPSAWRRPLAQLAAALDSLHGRGWVHRDVRPENAMLASPSRAVWIDLAAAGVVGQPRAGRSRGTPGYASPEQWAGLDPSPRDDVYSFGVVLWQLLTGFAPQAAVAPGPRLASGAGKAEDVPPPLRQWLAAALAARRSSRPTDLRAVAQLLADVDD